MVKWSNFACRDAAAQFAVCAAKFSIYSYNAMLQVQNIYSVYNPARLVYISTNSVNSLIVFADMGKEWKKNPEQKVYLDSFLEEFLVARADKQLNRVYSKCIEGWTERWPERTVLFPEWNEGDAPLSDEHMELLSDATNKRHEVSTYILVVKSV
jgi:hypothetical protein